MRGSGARARHLAQEVRRQAEREAQLLRDEWSIVIAAIAVAAGVRADIWMIAVPSFTFSVAAPHHASGVSASDP